MKRLLLLLPLLFMTACQSTGDQSDTIKEEGIIKVVCFEKEMAEVNQQPDRFTFNTATGILYQYDPELDALKPLKRQEDYAGYISEWNSETTDNGIKITKIESHPTNGYRYFYRWDINLKNLQVKWFSKSDETVNTDKGICNRDELETTKTL